MTNRTICIVQARSTKELRELAKCLNGQGLGTRMERNYYMVTGSENGQMAQSLKLDGSSAKWAGFFLGKNLILGQNNDLSST